MADKQLRPVGVELGKELAGKILGEEKKLLAGQEVDLEHHDSSTRALIKRFVNRQDPS